MVDASVEPSPADPIGDVAEDHGMDDDAAPLVSAVEKLYVPEEILERHTELVYKTKTGRYGARSKKVVGWRDRLLVKWATYSVAESTWESDVEYYKRWCAAIVAVLPSQVCSCRSAPCPLATSPANPVGVHWLMLSLFS